MQNTGRISFYFTLCNDTVSDSGLGYEMAHVVEALRYKSEGSGFDSRWGLWDFSFT
jgi:hypothetical protein